MLNLAKSVKPAAIAIALGTSLLSSVLLLKASSPSPAPPIPSAASGGPPPAAAQPVNPVPDLRNRLGAIAEMVAQLFRQNNGDPDLFVRLSFREGIPLKATQQVLDKDDLPRLYAIMKDPSQSDYWEKAAAIVAMIGNDAESAKELLDFAKRPIDWTVITTERRATAHVVAKASGIRWLGHMKDAGTDETLLRLLSPEGANELIKGWIDDPALPPVGRDKNRIIGTVRGSAAMGLVLTGKKEHAARVDELYKHVAVLPILPANEELYSQLVDAMAIKKFIAVEGMDRYEQAIGMSGMLNLLGPYLAEFNIRRRGQ